MCVFEEVYLLHIVTQFKKTLCTIVDIVHGNI